MCPEYIKTHIPAGSRYLVFRVHPPLKPQPLIKTVENVRWPNNGQPRCWANERTRGEEKVSAEGDLCGAWIDQIMSMRYHSV